MKRFHIHVAVADRTASIDFYSALFAAEPTVVKDDYATWMLDDPRVNFAISQRGATPGLDHLGVQVENEAELRSSTVPRPKTRISRATPHSGAGFSGLPNKVLWWHVMAFECHC